MGYAWEKYDDGNYYYMPKDKQSYYQEVWRREGKYVPVNIYNRFYGIFYPLSLNGEPGMMKEAENRYKNNEKFRDIFNGIVHQLVSWDRLEGITLEDIEMSAIYDDIKEGAYGDRLRSEIDHLEFEDLYIILKALVKSSTRNNNGALLGEVLRLLFGKVILYKENSGGKALIYIEQLRNRYREKLYGLAIYLFADMGLEIDNFWANEHFGIIGNGSTMRIGRMHIY